MKIYILNIVNIILFSITLLMLLNLYSRSNKIALIDYDKVFEGFNMANEMKKIGEKEYVRRSIVIDSLKTQLSKSNIASINDALTQQLIFAQEDLKNFGAAYAKDESVKIRTRIDDYAKKYSEENKYDLVIGIQENGNILFADNSLDATSDFIIYINKQYEGIK